MIFYGSICRTRYANEEIVVFERQSDCHVMMRTPLELAAEQEPWVLEPRGYWSPMSRLVVFEDPFEKQRS